MHISESDMFRRTGQDREWPRRFLLFRSGRLPVAIGAWAKDLLCFGAERLVVGAHGLWEGDVQSQLGDVLASEQSLV